MKSYSLLLLLFLIRCATIGTQHPIDLDTDLRAVEAVLDQLHEAAAKADGDSYFRVFHSSAVFIGTAQNERWNLQQLKVYANRFFSKGQGWTSIPHARHVAVAPNGQVAWFDESLTNETLGNIRGSGALIKENGSWKLSHYVLSFPIPNHLIKKVLPILKEQEATPPKMPPQTAPSNKDYRL